MFSLFFFFLYIFSLKFSPFFSKIFPIFLVLFISISSSSSQKPIHSKIHFITSLSTTCQHPHTTLACNIMHMAHLKYRMRPNNRLLGQTDVQTWSMDHKIRNHTLIKENSVHKTPTTQLSVNKFIFLHTLPLTNLQLELRFESTLLTQ